MPIIIVIRIIRPKIRRHKRRLTKTIDGRLHPFKVMNKKVRKPSGITHSVGGGNEKGSQRHNT
mgnify:FL=1